MERETTCCFTGHRPDKLPWRDDEKDPRCVALKERLTAAVEEAYDKGMRHFICGMARGADFYFCEAVLSLRERRPGVTVEAALPCEEQAARWKERDRNRYFSLVAQCDYETMVQHHYDKGCMLRRDRYMVDRSAMIIAVYGGVLGGTMYTLAYAMKKGLEVNILDVEVEKQQTTGGKT
ncbi:SLOG family protein [uncultured Pseudoflavonifractor sp.]|uniref:SLOG family protein n=1 Tax=uncultured Pseudoflavonifractor sp. TaxID=1221379 RepID=UPI0025FD956B|nr:SLOG family protein [uncultured Pseudoflavonifractor sp.]